MPPVAGLPKKGRHSAEFSSLFCVEVVHRAALNTELKREGGEGKREEGSGRERKCFRSGGNGPPGAETGSKRFFFSLVGNPLKWASHGRPFKRGCFCSTTLIDEGGGEELRGV